MILVGSAEKLRTIHEHSRREAQKEPLVRINTFRFVDRLTLPENGPCFFVRLLPSSALHLELLLPLGPLNRQSLINARCTKLHHPTNDLCLFRVVEAPDTDVRRDVRDE